ncbi:hypothetical protein [Fusobacterium polymorphum]|uniref:hypothetical protein n=1 Tax=Fusobacterium nucleatum subsp. polymorphum TaxID=76857 RepID=UPI00300AE134
MSYFEGLKLTKKGEQLQAKINGNLSETLTFTKAKLGSGSITSNDEIRFLTDVKEEWGTANVTSCKIQGDEKNIVAIELQFSNTGLRENKIFREIGLYAKGNDEEEILYAYANAGDKYDYIPLMKDSPHSFIIVIYFNITSGTKVDANIDLHSYITLQEFNERMSKKVNKTDYASAEQYGIVKYGTQENTALEGNKIEEITGKTYGGVLNEIGLKEAGKTYFDKNTKKLYLCKNNNTDISANINNYIAMDSHSILERLENLITIESYQNWNIGNGLTSSSAKVYKIGELKFVHISFTTDKVLTKFNFKFPVTFKESPYVSYTDNGGGSTLGVPFGIDWATTTGVLLSEVQSATMLVVGI